MALSGFVLGFADFRLPLSRDDAAALLSNELFGGIRFIEKENDDSRDAVTMQLEAAYCGIVAELIGSNGNYTIEIGTLPSASVADCSEVSDLSAMLKQQLSHVAGVTILPPTY